MTSSSGIIHLSSNRHEYDETLSASWIRPWSRLGGITASGSTGRRRRPRGRKNLHRALISHAVFLVRNLRPHYSAFISVLGRPPPVVSVLAPFFIYFSLLFSSSLFSTLSILFCLSLLICFARPRGTREGIYLVARADFQSFGRLRRSSVRYLRPVMYVETFVPRPVIIHKGLKVASLKFQLLVFSFFFIRWGRRSCVRAKIALARTISGCDVQCTAAVAKRLSAMMRVP